MDDAESPPTLKAGLYLVATPIGNLADISERAKSVLKNCQRILAEDTRHTPKLLNHAGIRKPLISCHEHNERGRVAEVLQWIRDGEAIALVTDAGTPSVSDPGFLMVREAAQAGLFVQAIPGPSALMAALVVSGLPTDRFIFEGFFPRKPGKSRRVAHALLEEVRTVIFYESPYRIAKTLQVLHEVLGDRQAVICRELTKTYEEIVRGDLRTLAHDAAKREWKGEITLVVAGCGKKIREESED